MDSDMMSGEANEESAAADCGERANKRRRKKSIVWEHFTIEAAGPSRMKACCIHCKKSFAYINGPKLAGTSHLKRHISLGICAGGARKAELTQPPSSAKSDPSPKRRYRNSSGFAGVPCNQERCTGDIARMIIEHSYPLHIVEHASFVNFVRALHPQYSMASFNTIQGECVALYLKEKQNLLTRISEIPGRVNLTLDLATSNLSIGFAYLTGQFIDKDWILQQRILSVVMLPFPESEYAYNQAVISCVSDWQLENKLFTLTIDGNESIMGNLRGLLPVKNTVLLNGQLLKGMCFARLLARLAQEAMEKVKEPITRIRECVKYVKTSETHDEKFSDLRQQLQVPSTKELVIDDQSKWNTTYLMLTAACELKEVFGCFETADPVYKINPSFDDWKEVEILCTYLKLFFEAASFVATPLPPPSNLFYHEVSKIQVELTHAASSQDVFVCNLTTSLKEKFDQYWKDSFLVLAMAVVMDPRFKMKLVEFSFAKLFGENAGSWIKAVDDGIHELFLDYVAPAPPSVRNNHSHLLLPHMEGFSLHQVDGSSHGFSQFCEEMQPGEKKYEAYSEEMISHDYPPAEVLVLDHDPEGEDEKGAAQDAVLEARVGDVEDEKTDTSDVPVDAVNTENAPDEMYQRQETSDEIGAQGLPVHVDEGTEVNEQEERNSTDAGCDRELPVGNVDGEDMGQTEQSQLPEQSPEGMKSIENSGAERLPLEEATEHALCPGIQTKKLHYEEAEETQYQDRISEDLPKQETGSLQGGLPYPLAEERIDTEGPGSMVVQEEQINGSLSGVETQAEAPKHHESLPNSAQHSELANQELSQETSDRIFFAQEQDSHKMLVEGAETTEILIVEGESLHQEAPILHHKDEEIHHEDASHELQNSDVNSQDIPILSSGDGLSDFEVYISAIGNQHMKSELDQYLEESLLPRVQEFDILGWWKLNKLKYPTLSKLAADILSIPLSTVGPESVFDTTNKKIDSYYCSLHPLTLEAIICAKDWLHGVSSSSSDVDVTNVDTKMDF